MTGDIPVALVCKDVLSFCPPPPLIPKKKRKKERKGGRGLRLLLQ